MSVSNVHASELASRKGLFWTADTDDNKNALLLDRLDELLVLELRQDGRRDYIRLSVRGLYKRILGAITAPWQQPLDDSKNAVPEAPATDHEDKAVSFAADTKKTDGSELPTVGESTEAAQVTYRERLGGYLHPRDLRRLITPFSGSNEPDIIVRRHVILLNYDPLRAIIVRDRLLVIVPDGMDDILFQLERRVRGGVSEVEDSILGDYNDYSEDMSSSRHKKGLIKSILHKTAEFKDEILHSVHGSGGARTASRKQSSSDASKTSVASTMGRKGPTDSEKTSASRAPVQATAPPTNKSTRATEAAVSEQEEEIFERPDLRRTDRAMTDLLNEWHEIEAREWISIPWELTCADACLHIVSGLLAQETAGVQESTSWYTEKLFQKKGKALKDPLLHLRQLKDKTGEMRGRVTSYVKSLNRILDNDEYMSLMNLTRLLTHPERFIQPVPPEVLEEESDEPELILEAHLQIGFTLTNNLNQIENQITTASDFLDQNQDAIRNRILLANMIISAISLSVAAASLVGSIFGMNVVNGFEDGDEYPYIFRQIVFGSVAGAVALTIFIMVALVWSGTIPSRGWGAE